MSSLLGPLLPDELIWSYVGRLGLRYTTLGGEAAASVLGGFVPSYRKAFPTRLASIASALTYHGAPDVRALIRGHTFFPFAVPEISASDTLCLERSLAEHSFPRCGPEHLTHSMEFRLRICPQCCAEDRATYGISYWHRMHQIPVVVNCVKHGKPLLETTATAGQRRFLSVENASVTLTPFKDVDPDMQRALVTAYTLLSQHPTASDRGCIIEMLRSLLRERGFFANRQVQDELTALLKSTFSDEGLDLVGLRQHNQRLSSWVQVPKLAAVCYALDVPFHAFLEGATAKMTTRTLSASAEPSSPQASDLLKRIADLAPAAAALLRSTTSRRVSVWAIAQALKPQLGSGFVTNWSWKPTIHEALKKFTESDLEFGNRRLVAMAEDANKAADFRCVSRCFAAFGIKRLADRNPEFAKNAMQVYQETCNTVRP